MTVEQLTTAPTEADLEAEIHHAITIAFPWIPSTNIRHQTKFSFKFGHKTIEIDSKKNSHAEARSDIILLHENRHLAVLELKRRGVPLSPEDEAQGLSYARVLVPSPPLVIVTNGNDIRFIETFSGKPWAPQEKSHETFKALMTNAARIANTDLRQAIDTLMGTNTAVWIQAVRQVSIDTIAELTSSVGNPALPFSTNFLFPRLATFQLMQLITQQKLILLKGAPLAGKSNILRGLFQLTSQHEKKSLFYIEGGVGQGILGLLADALSRSLTWTLTKEEVRSWLMQVSRNSEYRLILAIDGLHSADESTRREIEDLTSPSFGPGLCVVVATEDNTAEKLAVSSNRLSASPIGRRATHLSVDSLNDSEFELVQRVLTQKNISFIPGASFSHEYRKPWVLRAIIEPAFKIAPQTESNFQVTLPPLLGIELIKYTRERFDNDELRRLFRALAKAILDEMKDHNRDHSIILESLEVYLLRREVLKNHIESKELDDLICWGFLKAITHKSGEQILIIRLPELLSSELALLLAAELIPIIEEDPHEAAMWLAGIASNLPIGDIIAAQVIFDAAHRPGSISFDLIDALLKTPPRPTQVSPGTKYAMKIPGADMVELTFQEDGSAVVEIDGELFTLDITEEQVTYDDVYPWLILSHLAAFPFALEYSGEIERVDPKILLEVGTINVVLRKPSGGIDAVPTHGIPNIGSIVCHEAGIVEPITYSIFRYLANEDTLIKDDWIHEAVTKQSMPLLARTHIALIQVSRSANKELATWAKTTLTSKVLPAFNLLPNLHNDEE